MAKPMDFLVYTAAYEHWLGGHLPLVAADLHKASPHGRGAVSVSACDLLSLDAARGRSAALSPALAPHVLAVGDIHMENYGTWRQPREGRLAWGVNDFDEAVTLPYTLDLVRLAASMHAVGRAAHPRGAAGAFHAETGKQEELS